MLGTQCVSLVLERVKQWTIFYTKRHHSHFVWRLSICVVMKLKVMFNIGDWWFVPTRGMDKSRCVSRCRTVRVAGSVGSRTPKKL